MSSCGSTGRAGWAGRTGRKRQPGDLLQPVPPGEGGHSSLAASGTRGSNEDDLRSFCCCLVDQHGISHRGRKFIITKNDLLASEACWAVLRNRACVGALKDGCGTDGTAPHSPCSLMSLVSIPCHKECFQSKTFTGALAGTCPEELKASQEEEAAIAEHLRALRGAFPSSPISACKAFLQPWLSFSH